MAAVRGVALASGTELTLSTDLWGAVAGTMRGLTEAAHRQTSGERLARGRRWPRRSRTTACWLRGRSRRWCGANTTSAAGLFGNFGQTNYGAAKMGLVGFTKALAQEGRKRNVLANVIAPGARTRMTEDLLGPMANSLDPEAVTPVVVYLASEQCDVTGQILSVAGGRVSRGGRPTVRLPEVGHRELRFIELYGGVFGFAVGMFQAAAYSVFGLWWTMPIVGAIVGLGTNWLAIQMIFRPLEPRRYLGLVTYQGMFPKRQAEIAHDYGRIAAGEVLTPANLIDHIAANPAAPELVSELVGQARAQLDQFRPMLAMIAGTEPTDDQLDKVTFVLTQRLGELVPQARAVVEEHLSQSLRLDVLIEERLSILDKHQFERMLRGIFEEDEIILVLIGGMLGGVVGSVQGAIVLAAGW